MNVHQYTYYCSDACMPGIGRVGGEGKAEVPGYHTVKMAIATSIISSITVCLVILTWFFSDF